MITYNIIPTSLRTHDTILFAGNGNIDFVKKVAKYFPKCLSDCEITTFSDGEVRIPHIKENVRNHDCVIIQTVGISTKKTINDLLMELFILIDALKRGSARNITVVLPIFPYQRQDRKDYSRAPISSKVIAQFLEVQGISRVICFDLHAGQIQGFFDKIPLDNLFSEPYFIQYIRENFTKDQLNNNFVIISPDEGGVKRATRVADKLGCDVAIIYKERKKANEISKMVLMGNINEKICFIIDDIIDTAGTACKACDVLIDNGATSVYIGACHGILSGPAIERINKSKFTKVIVTNTIEIEERFPDNDKIEVLDISEMCASAIDRSLTGKSLSELMKIDI